MVKEATFREGIGPAVRHGQRQSRADDECGSAILETALSILILLSFVFGIMEISLAAYSYSFVSESSRKATRYAIVRGSSAGATSGSPVGPACASFNSYDCVASVANIQSYVKNLGFPGIDPSKMTVTVVRSGYPVGVTCTPSSSCNNPGNLIKVTVQYNFPFAVPLVPASTIAMTSTSAMVISQ